MLNPNIKNNGFTFQNSGQSPDAEPNRLSLFLPCMRVLICKGLTKISGSSFMQQINKHTSLFVHWEIKLLKLLCLKLKACGKKSKRNLQSLLLNQNDDDCHCLSAIPSEFDFMEIFFSMDFNCFMLTVPECRFLCSECLKLPRQCPQ